MYENEFKTKGRKIWIKDKIEPQRIHLATKLVNVTFHIL